MDLIINENIRKKNFDAFERRYGFRPLVDPEEVSKYRAEASANSELVLYIRNALPSGDLRLNSVYDPGYEAERWADKQDILNRRTTIGLLGFSTGVFLRALRKKLRPDTVFFVYEPEEGLFSFVCGFVDYSDIIDDKDIRLYISEKQYGSLSATMIDDIVTFRAEARGIITPFYAGSDFFTDLCKEIERITDATKNYQEERGRNALKCRIYSWNHMRENYLLSDFKKELPPDLPAVIVAAGPSLRKNVEILNRIKGHALIICTDRAVSVLNEYGIIPDAVTSLDAEKDPAYLKADITRDVPLICSHQVNSETQKLFEGRCIFYHQLEYEKYILGDKIEAINGLDQGGNVAGGSFVVCKLLGIKTIILIGQDLAYLNGEHHADGKSEGAGEMITRKTEGIDGSMVETNDMWLSFKDFYEREIRLNPDITVIDATEGGAKIEGTKIMTLSEVADMVENKSYDLKGIFGSIPKAQTDEEYEQSVKRQKGWIEDLDRIAEESLKVADLCSQLLKISKYQDIGDPKVAKKLRKLDELRAPIVMSLTCIMMEEFWIKDLYSIPDITFMVRNNEEAIPVFENAVEFYKSFPEDCRSLKAEMERAISEQ
ncbi:motility associated factor glycosyltransferase family protein [Butyrivibrio sp. VCD2006]|uniref:motility associated factor glycosyltransferase family protein n=1 Tax=Butyrivibrio sp. VCD2006 TaxID=1280664 RepID=UPI00041F87A1|nr:6-hydroxymethylpterin diphosphokinase MptE-like protein [Butyrivibrio sp. VCD2006]